MVTVCWVFSFWHHCDLVKRVKFGDSRRFGRTHGVNGLKYCMLLYPAHLHNWLDYGHFMVIIQVFVLFWLGEAGQIVVWGFSRKTYGGNRLTFCILLYHDNLQNSPHHCHSLMILLILALFWLSETGQIFGFPAFSRENIEGIAGNFACWCILITFRN